MLQTLQENKLYVKLSKGEFWLRGVNFLGQVISSEGISLELSKFDAMLQWETMKSVTEIKIFLDLGGHYQRFIEGFSKLDFPLKGLLKGSSFCLGCSV